MTWQARQVGSRPARRLAPTAITKVSGQHRPVHVRDGRQSLATACAISARRAEGQHQAEHAAGQADHAGLDQELAEDLARARRPARGARRSSAARTENLASSRPMVFTRHSSRKPKASQADSLLSLPTTFSVFHPLRHVEQLVRRVALQAAQLALLVRVAVEPGLQRRRGRRPMPVSNQNWIQVHSEVQAALRSPAPRFVAAARAAVVLNLVADRGGERDEEFVLAAEVAAEPSISW